MFAKISTEMVDLETTFVHSYIFKCVSYPKQRYERADDFLRIVLTKKGY